MKVLTILWFALILFSFITFCYLSVKIIVKGFRELKEMLLNLKEKTIALQKEENLKEK